jgi:uncharacterized protein (TIGR02271 family)
MYQDQKNMNTANWQIADGMTVYATDGTKLGTIENYNPADGYLAVRKGWLFPKDFFVPMGAVETVTEDGVVLGLARDALDDDRNAVPPTFTDATAGTYGQTTRDTGATALDIGTGLAQGEDIRVPVREEELVAGKRAEEQGRVHLHKDVVEEQQSIDVPVSQERVTVERVPYTGGEVPTDDAFVERDIDVPLKGEEAVAEKRVRGVEEVRVRKDMTTEHEQVSDTVRKERVTVDGVDENGRATAGTRVRSAVQNAADDLRTIKDRGTDK